LERDAITRRARVMQVPASVLEELHGHLVAHVDHDPAALLFTTPSGTPVRISNWRHKVWQPAADEFGLPAWATPYVLRHTAASLMAQRGVPTSAAARAAARLGHLPIFLRTYAHLYPGDLSAVADAMELARVETLRVHGNRSPPVEVIGHCRAGKRGDESEGGEVSRQIAPLNRKLVEAMGLEPTNLLTASQALYQLSYAPSGGGQR
jgi:hypothetical protein